ncbi:MAG: hydrogenase maturation nickel metallochaperone HypA [Thermodesulfobacteriota bacterium]
MHELSLVQGLLDQLERLVTENKAGKVLKVRVEIGPRSGIVIDSFKFGFEVLAAEHVLCREAELEVVSPTPVYRCSGCGALLESHVDAWPVCSSCGRDHAFPEGGEQLVLLQVEMV